MSNGYRISDYWYLLRVFGQFLRRDFYRYRLMWKHYAFNAALIRPMTYAISFGYILPHASIGNISQKGAALFFIGSILWTLFPLAYNLNKEFLVDLEYDRYINFQLMLLPARLVLLERIFFSSIIVFINNLFFFPLASVLLGIDFFSPEVSIIKFLLLIYLGALLCSAINIFTFCYIDSISQVGDIWIRFNHPMITLGGFLMPWYVMNSVSRLVGYLALLNPLMYISEGLKSTFSNDARFFSFGFSVFGIVSFTVLFTYLAWYFFKKKTDHI